MPTVLRGGGKSPSGRSYSHKSKEHIVNQEVAGRSPQCIRTLAELGKTLAKDPDLVRSDSQPGLSLLLLTRNSELPSMLFLVVDRSGGPALVGGVQVSSASVAPLVAGHRVCCPGCRERLLGNVRLLTRLPITSLRATKRREMMAEAASHEQQEGEAMAGAAVVTVISPRDRRALRRILPHLVQGVTLLSRILRGRRITLPRGRPLPRSVPCLEILQCARQRSHITFVAAGR